MKKFVIALIFFSACRPPQTDISTQTAKEISDADIAMNNIAIKDGFYKALLMYAEDSVILPREGKLPIMGKANAIKAWDNKPGTTGISWAPYKAMASASGNMGYTFGFWQFKSKDTTTYGNYCTIWHKQKDGSWKFVFDGGNNTPNLFK